MYISDVSSVQFKMYIVQVKQEKIYVSPKLLVRRTCWSSETYTFFLSVVTKYHGPTLVRDRDASPPRLFEKF